MMKRLLPLALFCAVATLVACATTEPPGKPEYMVVGIDNKTKWGDDGKASVHGARQGLGHDRRHRHGSCQPEDRRQSPADEFGLWSADQLEHYP